MNHIAGLPANFITCCMCYRVCYMAGVFVENLKLYQPELGITDCDVLCVKVAALCHDMGHGPFSDFFQQLFIPEVCNGLKWTVSS